MLAPIAAIMARRSSEQLSRSALPAAPPACVGLGWERTLRRATASALRRAAVRLDLA